MNSNSKEILIFVIQDQRFAIQLQAVERVIRAQAITIMAESPAFIEGVIDYYGEVIAVINLRKRFAYSNRNIQLNDRFIIANMPSRKLALIVDEVEDVVSPDDLDLDNARDIDKGLKIIKFFRSEKGIVLIYDLENLLDKTEEIELQKLLVNNSPAEI